MRKGAAPERRPFSFVQMPAGADADYFASQKGFRP
jgi:hypothetical protein